MPTAIKPPESPVRMATPRQHRSNRRYKTLGKAIEADVLRLHADLREADTASQSKFFRQYEKAYQKDVGTKIPLTVMRRSDVVFAATQSDLVFAGDYHTAQGSKNVALELLKGLVDRDTRPTLLAIEFAFQNTKRT